MTRINMGEIDWMRKMGTIECQNPIHAELIVLFISQLDYIAN